MKALSFHHSYLSLANLTLERRLLDKQAGMLETQHQFGTDSNPSWPEQRCTAVQGLPLKLLAPALGAIWSCRRGLWALTGLDKQKHCCWFWCQSGFRCLWQHHSSLYRLTLLISALSFFSFFFFSRLHLEASLSIAKQDFSEVGGFHQDTWKLEKNWDTTFKIVFKEDFGERSWFLLRGGAVSLQCVLSPCHKISKRSRISRTLVYQSARSSFLHLHPIFD